MYMLDIQMTEGWGIERLAVKLTSQRIQLSVVSIPVYSCADKTKREMQERVSAQKSDMTEVRQTRMEKLLKVQIRKRGKCNI